MLRCDRRAVLRSGDVAELKARLLQEMKSDGVSPNSLFLERQLSYILDLPREEGKVTGQDELQSHLQGLSAEAREDQER